MWGLESSQQAPRSSTTGRLSDLVCALGGATPKYPYSGLAEGERVSFSIGQGLYTIHGLFRKLHSPEVGSAPMQCSAMARWQPLNFQASYCAYLEHVNLMLNPHARARPAAEACHRLASRAAPRLRCTLAGTPLERERQL